MFEKYADNLDESEDLIPVDKDFRIIFDNIQYKWRIFCRYDEDLEDLKKAFACENKAAFYMKMHGYNVDTKHYVVNQFGYFPVGLIFEVLKYIRLEYGDCSTVAMSKNAIAFMNDHLMPLRKFASDRDKNEFKISNVSSSLEPREYQVNAIKSIIFDGRGRGLLELPTGSGKSFVIANFIYTLLQQYDSELRTLIFVPNKQLVEQFYSDLVEYGFDKSILGKLTGSMKKNDPTVANRNTKIVIGNRQYLCANPDKVPEKLDVFIADECHQITPDSATYEFVEKINCPIKIGCSGTLPREKYSKLLLTGLFSKMFYSENITDLQSQGFLTKINITLLNLFDEQVEFDRDKLFSMNSRRKFNAAKGNIAFNAAYSAETEYLTENCEELYSPVLDYVEKNYSGKNVLVLFDRIEFGKKIFAKAENDYKSNESAFHKPYYIDGSVKVETREAIRAEFEKTSGNILYAQTTVMSTGVNIKNLSVIVFLFQTKSASRVIQSIGRTLRLHAGKDFSAVIDVVFNYKYSQKHYEERLNLYKEFYKKKKPDKIVNLSVGLGIGA